jgi:predicted transcriptional regulator
MSRHYLTQDDIECIKRHFEKDTPNWQIAEDIGCSESCIERKAKKLGLKKTRTGPKGGERHTNWKGGVTMRKGYRYIYCPDHPNAVFGKKYVAEHRLVMEKKLCRYLDRKEVVHHIDGNPLNNHPDNLAVFGCNADHLRHELTGKCPNWSASGWARMQEAVRKPRTPRKSKSCD